MQKGISIIPYLLGVIAIGILLVYTSYSFSRGMLRGEKLELSEQQAELIATYMSRYLVKAAIIGETISSDEGGIILPIEPPPSVLGEGYWIEIIVQDSKQAVKVYLDIHRDVCSEQTLFNLLAEEAGEQWRFQLGDLKKTAGSKLSPILIYVEGGYIGFAG